MEKAKRTKKQKTPTGEDFLSNYDLFATKMPGFTIKGIEKVGTWVGFISTIVLVMIMTIYALIKMDVVINRKSPSLN
jgi:hypothetical protein